MNPEPVVAGGEGTQSAWTVANNGYARRFERRPDFHLYGHIIPEEVDASSIRKRKVQNLDVVRIKDIFAGTGEIFIGFGRPNVYLVIPDGKGGYVKFAGKSFKRAPSTIEDTRGFVQSGVILRLRNVPVEAIERLRAAMEAHNGEYFWTCANAIMTVMQDAGFACTGAPLNQRFIPDKLLSALLVEEMTFDGQPIQLEVVRTTTEWAQLHAAHIWWAQLTTFCRHGNKHLETLGAKYRVVKWLHWVLLLPFMLFGWITKPFRPKAVETPLKPPPVAPELPVPEGTDLPRDLEMRVSRTSVMGAALRLIWGPHALFQVSQTRVDVRDYLDETMLAFPQKNPSLATRLKKWILFSRPVIWLIRKMLARSFVYIGTRDEIDIYDMLRTDSTESPNRYNLVLTRSSITVARLKVSSDLVDWILSKHVLMSGYDRDVIFAGELWKDEHGIIHVSRNSGTYRPTEEQLDAVLAFLRQLFPHMTFVKD